MLDIDFFKRYNDNYGHDMGDKCLKEVASVLSQCITRKDDFVARFGGEEFVVVLPNTDKTGACMIAERLLQRVYESGIPHEKNDAAEFVTVSIGVTTGIVKYSQNGTDYVKCADSALYKSKRGGRNRYTFEAFGELAEDSGIGFTDGEEN
jgi:diguanylate cyclase (GGDEF)-like protein